MTAVMVLAWAVVGCSSAASSVDSADGGRDPQRRGPQGEIAQFVVQCAPSHVAYDDPIVHPGMGGKSHRHQFFGNARVGADADSASVVGAHTSCEQPLDTASYWAPALLSAAGTEQEPLGMTAYYRPGLGVDPAEVIAYPAGLMLVAGDAMAIEQQPTSIVAWSCGSGADREVRPPKCPSTTTLRMIVTFPDCWDGEHIEWDASAPSTVYSNGGCPAEHPVAVPQLTIAIDYPSVDPAGLSLASGDIITGHADFWNVWNQEKLEQEVALCLNRDLVCGVSDGGSLR